MSMYKKVDTSLNFVEREKQVVDYWNENHIFEDSVKMNEGKEEFSFYDGPPTANGKPHIGHILTRVMKDIVPRYQTMKGKHVLRKAGWDTHGLPVELEVEKKLGFDHKTEIEAYGIEPFIKECKKSVWQYTSEWKRMSDRVGYWCDMDNPYVTYHDDYIESEWWALKKIHEKGLLYKGHKIVPYCPRCGTALSSHEVAQGYKDVKQVTAFVKFKVKGDENRYILAWTTTPWTLPSNVALCMNPDADYVEIECEESGEKYILAEALVPAVFGEEKYTVLSKKKGKEYEYTEYEPLYPYGKEKFAFREKAYYVTCDDYVTLSDGTGVVHTATAFGEDDYRVGRKYNLPVVQLIDEEGKFPSGCDFLTGMAAQAADPLVIKDLKARGLLLKTQEIVHSYPFCWRCDTPLIYYARSSWFIKVTAVKDRLIAANRSVNWMPDTIKEGRMGNFLENVIDWGLSRDRYWGTPLPVWVCPDCGEIEVIGSKAELKERCGVTGDTIELHRPYVDGPHLRLSQSAAGRCRARPRSSTAGSIRVPCRSRSITIRLKTRRCSTRRSPRTLSPRPSIRRGAGSIRCSSSRRSCSTRRPSKIVSSSATSTTKTASRCPSTRATSSIRGRVLDKQGADAVRWYFYTSSAPWLPSRFLSRSRLRGAEKVYGHALEHLCVFLPVCGHRRVRSLEIRSEKMPPVVDGQMDICPS